MAYNPSPKVRDAESYAKKHGFDKVIIIGIDEKNGTMNGTSYGKDEKECNYAKKLMDAAYQAIYDKIIELV